MALEHLAKCPLSPQCNVKGLFWDTEKLQVMKLDNNTHQLKVHYCRGIGLDSVRPETFYMAKWKNAETGKFRWLGPERQIYSVMKPTVEMRRSTYVDDPTKCVWELLEVQVTHDVPWRTMDMVEAQRLFNQRYNPQSNRPTPGGTAKQRAERRDK